MRSAELCLDGAVDVAVDVVGADQVDDSINLKHREDVGLTLGLPEKEPAAEAKALAEGDAVARALAELTEREREVLEQRFGLKDGYSRTLEEVGRQFQVTRERIRQIEAKALRKMRHPTRIRKLEGFIEIPGA